MLRAFIKDSIIYLVPAVISRGLSLFLVPLYTRVLSPADYGSLDLLLVFTSLVNLTVALEVSQGVARHYGTEEDLNRKVSYASTALWFTVFCYSMFLILAQIFSVPLGEIVMGRIGLESVFRIGLVYIWLNGIFYLIQNQFRWELRSTNYAVVSCSMTLVTVAVAVYLAYGLRMGLLGLLYGKVAGSFAGCAYGLWHLQNSFRLRFSLNRLKEMLIFSAPLVPSGIAVFISHYIDRIMLNHYLTLNEVGLYGIGFRLASVAGLAMVGFQGALTPLVYSNYKNPETPSQLERIFRTFLAVSLCMFLGLSLFASEILVLMTTPAFYGAAQVVVFLVPAILLSNMYIFSPGIFIAKKTHLILYINLIGAVLNTVLNWLLIPAMGISGAALATLLGYGCVFSVYMIISQRLYQIPHQWKRIVSAVVISGLLAYWVPRLELEWGLQAKGMALLVGGALILFSGLVRLSELNQLKFMVLNKNKPGDT